MGGGGLGGRGEEVRDRKGAKSGQKVRWEVGGWGGEVRR